MILLNHLTSEGQIVKQIGDKKMVVLTLEQGNKINLLIDSLEKQYKLLNINRDSISIINNILKDSLSIKSNEVINFRILFEQSMKDMDAKTKLFNSEIKIARNKNNIDQVTIGLVTLLVFFLYTKTY